MAQLQVQQTREVERQLLHKLLQVWGGRLSGWDVHSQQPGLGVLYEYRQRRCFTAATDGAPTATCSPRLLQHRAHQLHQLHIVEVAPH